VGIIPFQRIYVDNVLLLCESVFNQMNLTSFLWQPCQQIESLDKDCKKYVYLENEIKGYVAVYQLDETHFRLNLIVSPQYSGQGLGTLLLEKIESEAKKRDGKYLQARVLENMESSIAFALARGFTEIHRMRGMSFYAEDFSFAKWQELGKQLSTSGFSATTLKAEADNNPIDKLAGLLRYAREGWLSPDPTQQGNMIDENLRSFFMDISVPEHFSIMKFRDVYVAYTSAEQKNLTGTAYLVLTPIL
jgi:hypothetical protein